jgi:UDP-GlcNAc:undecaprenyl-phosphate GlcNAc-1-phosphate transferase
MIQMLAAFVPSFVLGWLILRLRHRHEALTGDVLDGGPQKIHTDPVPRIGGLMIFVGFTAGIAYVSSHHYLPWRQILLILVCALPAFAGGFFEDLAKHGGVLLRLFATFLSAGLAYWLLGARLDRLDFPLVDAYLGYMPLSLVFTMFAAGGISQSINIIDGLNGLALFVGMTILASIGWVAYELNDQLVLDISLATIGGMLGLFAWNFPLGKIFCGDGGAYFVGFVIAEVSVLLVHRHHEVSAWFPLILVAYPFWETMFSIYRRRLVSGKSATQPDALHLHSLVYRWVVRLCAYYGVSEMARWRKNSLSSVICWIFPIGAALCSVLFWAETWKLAAAAFAFASAYVLVYRELVKPANWRRLRRRKATGSAAIAGMQGAGALPK